MSTNFTKNVLLTGAGFTANFGGPLAREMWAKILNNPKIESLPEIRALLLSNFDFEDVYSQVSKGAKFSQADKELFQSIILEAYLDMDQTLISYVNNGFNQYNTNWSGVSTFLTLFGGTSTEKGAHFTLNQDILLERARVAVPLGLTAVRDRQYWDSLFGGQIDPNQKITLYTDTELEEFKVKHLPSSNPSYYIKLHGSRGWLSYDTGKEQMVLGKNKAEDIDHEPLLKWFFELFKEALNRNDVKLFVIGYSFRDQHVNDCIIEAIEKYGLKLYIISPENPQTLRDRLEGKISNGSYNVDTQSMKIWNAIHGYYPYKLGDIFPNDRSQTVTQVAKDLKKLLGQ